MDLTMTAEKTIPGFSGRVFWRDGAGYEEARGAAAWRANKPRRYPAVIVYPEHDGDVVAAVNYARAHGLQVGRRSGGHSWVSPHIRDGAMLIDLRMMQDFEIDAAAGTVWTRPSVKSRLLNDHAAQFGVMFPGGHHSSVGVGGFVMCGGYGWNARQWGNGAANLLAIEMVTADGELITADETQNQDYLWAARGAGPGFPGVVTRMKLRLHRRPKHIRRRVYVYGLEDLDAVLGWSMEIIPKLPDFVEPIITSNSVDYATGDWAPTKVGVVAVAFGDDPDELDRALDLFETCPVRQQAKFTAVDIDIGFKDLYLAPTAVDPEGYRYAADSIWTNAPATEVVPLARELFTTLPTPYTHIFWQLWGKQPPFDMALSVQAELFIAVYAVWNDPTEDARMSVYPAEQMRRFEKISVGSQLNDDGSLYRASRYLSEAAAARLEAIRDARDPKRVFLSYLKVGDPY